MYRVSEESVQRFYRVDKKKNMCVVSNPHYECILRKVKRIDPYTEMHS